MGDDEEDRSNTDADENRDSPCSEELEETCKNGENQVISEYEKQRLSRIKENKARLESLGLLSLASSVFDSLGVQTKRKGKAKAKAKAKKKDEDEEYKPVDGEDRISSSSEEEEEEEEGKDDEDDEEFQVKKVASSRGRRASTLKGKLKRSPGKSRNKKKVPVRELAGESDFINDDEALEQALALSLEGSSELSAAVRGPPLHSRTDVRDTDPRDRKRDGINQKYDKGKKRRKPNSIQAQLTEDQVVIHFFQFDEAGKGNITLKDLERVMCAHDFTWTENEMHAMIRCFDSDGDGKLNLDDFRKILQRCNMIQGSDENAST